MNFKLSFIFCAIGIGILAIFQIGFYSYGLARMGETEPGMTGFTALLFASVIDIVYGVVACVSFAQNYEALLWFCAVLAIILLIGYSLIVAFIVIRLKTYIYVMIIFCVHLGLEAIGGALLGMQLYKLRNGYQAYGYY